MPLTTTEAQQLDRLALAALDALRDMDRLAVLYATELDAATGRQLAGQLAQATIRRDDTERELLDAIHGMTRQPNHLTNGHLEQLVQDSLAEWAEAHPRPVRPERPRGRLRAFLTRP